MARLRMEAMAILIATGTLHLVVANDLWPLTETGKYCSPNMYADIRDSLIDCQTHCETIGARRLTFYPDDSCLCCSASSVLRVSSTGGKIYTRPGTPGGGATVSCGNHEAATCSECPQGNGAAWCNGDCTWQDDECVSPDACYSSDTTYTGNPVRGIKNFHVKGITSVKDCQEECVKDPDCNFFTWNSPDFWKANRRNTCWLQASKGTIKQDCGKRCSGKISGPKTCDDDLCGLSNQFKCTAGVCKPNHCTDEGSACIPRHFQCDGQWDCTDGSDEKGCRG